MKNFITNIFAKNTLIHGALMAAIGAIAGIIMPILTGLSNGNGMPPASQIEPIVLHALYVGLGAFLAYLLKNGIAGSSNITKAATVILIGFMMFCAPTSSKAQYIINAPVQMPGIRGLAGDTITNTGTRYDSILLASPFPSGSILTLLTKISGTVSPTIILQGSVDGLHWTTFGQDTSKPSNITGTYAFTWQLPGFPTKSAATGSTQTIMTPTILPFLYYRVFATGTGTMSAIIKSYIAPR